MAKSNYNKIEDAIDKGLHDLKVEGLLREADEAQGKSKKGKNKKDELTPKQVMIIIELELKWMYKQDHSIYKILKLKRKKVEDLLKLVNTPGIKLKKKELAEINSLKAEVDMLKKTRFSPKDDEEFLEDEIDRHVYKRHNVKEEWIPMDTHSDWDKYNPKEKS